jgi:hypothetical protein
VALALNCLLIVAYLGTTGAESLLDRSGPHCPKIARNHVDAGLVPLENDCTPGSDNGVAWRSQVIAVSGGSVTGLVGECARPTCPVGAASLTYNLDQRAVRVTLTVGVSGSSNPSNARVAIVALADNTPWPVIVPGGHSSPTIGVGSREPVLIKNLAGVRELKIVFAMPAGHIAVLALKPTAASS